jgi:exoribonuclease R
MSRSSQRKLLTLKSLLVLPILAGSFANAQARRRRMRRRSSPQRRRPNSKRIITTTPRICIATTMCAGSRHRRPGHRDAGRAICTARLKITASRSLRKIAQAEDARIQKLLQDQSLQRKLRKDYNQRSDAEAQQPLPAFRPRTHPPDRAQPVAPRRLQAAHPRAWPGRRTRAPSAARATRPHHAARRAGQARHRILGAAACHAGEDCAHRPEALATETAEAHHARPPRSPASSTCIATASASSAPTAATNREDDLFIPPNELNGAMQGDEVLVDEAPPGRDGRRSGRIAPHPHAPQSDRRRHLPLRASAAPSRDEFQPYPPRITTTSRRSTSA